MAEPRRPLRPAWLDGRTLLAILGLAVTQMTGWGTTYYLPAVLVGPLEADLHLSREVIFGGVTVMLLVGAVVAPRAGAYIGRNGARAPMVLGSVLLALSLAVLAAAQGLPLYVLAWAIVGVGLPLGLTQAAVSAMAMIAGPNARRAISALLLVSGASSSLFWPLTAWLEASVGWRITCLVFAALNLLVCAPIHALLLRRGAAGVASEGSAAAYPDAGLALSASQRRLGFVLAAIAFSFAGFVTWGLPLHAIEILKGLGLPAATAVLVGTLIGPSQIAARIAEVAFGGRAGILAVGVIAMAVLPVAIALPLVAELSVPVAVGFMIGYGLSAGAMTIVRSVAPLTLFGRDAYAVVLGRLAVPQNVAFALSPMLLAAVMSHAGPRATLGVVCGASVLGFAAMLALAKVGAPREAAQVSEEPMP
jgi:predicted MFS family arabinose efflux permease